MMRPTPRSSTSLATTVLAFLVVIALAPSPVAPSEAGGDVDSFVHLPWTPMGTGSFEYLGLALAPAGDVNGDGYGDVLLAAPGDSVVFNSDGKVFLFLGSVNGLSTVPAWSTSGGQAGAFAGKGLGPAGDVNGDGYADVLIGMASWDSPTLDVGRVFVFHGGPNGLPVSPNRILNPPANQVELFFGQSLGTAGDVNGDGYGDVVIGAPGYNDAGGGGRGAAWIYHGGPTGLPATPARMLLGAAQNGGAFGYSVSTAGDLDADGFDDVVVGAPFVSMGFPGSGAVSFYRGSPTGIPAVADTVIGGRSTDGNFGWAVTTLGDYVGFGFTVVAASEPGGTFDIQPAHHGMVRRFYGGQDGIIGSDVTLGPFVLANERFGTSLATIGDINGDGFPDYAVGGMNVNGGGTGRVTLVFGDGGEGVYGPTSYPPPGPTTTTYGAAIATSGDVNGDGVSELLIGDPGITVGAFTSAGRALLLALPRNNPKPMPGWPVTGPQPGTNYGQSIAVLPQFLQSAVPMVVVGDPGFNGTGRFAIYGGLPGGLSTVPSFSETQSPGSFYSLGARVIDAGDMNRDGYGDLVVSAPTADTFGSPPDGAFQVGHIYLYSGGLKMLQASLQLEGSSDFDRVGTALAGRGDVNGDGFQDVVVGAAGWDAGFTENVGKVWVLYGGVTGTTGTPWMIVGTQFGEGLGASVALCDFDGDGYSDVIVGSANPQGGPPDGRVYIYYGGPGGPPTTPAVTLQGVLSPSFGFAVAAVGDITGDGICDLGVGAPDEDGVGRVYLYAGTRGRSRTPVAAWTQKGVAPAGRFGETISGGGDLDGDGRADLVIGAPSVDVLNPDEGAIYVFHGANEVPAHLPSIAFGSNQLGAKLGASLAPLADVNGDGYADLIAGAPGQAGRVYAYFGHGSPGTRRHLELNDVIGETTPRRYHPARLISTNQVEARMPITFPAGRTRIFAEFETVTQNTLFTGVPTSRDGTPYFEGPGTNEAEIMLPLPWPGRGYHVRSRWVSRSPYFQRTRWTTPEAHASGDLDVWAAGAVVGVDPAGPGTGAGPRIARVSPNPAGAARGAATRIDYVLPAAGSIAIDVYAVDGARVRHLLDTSAAAGAGAVSWDGRADDGRMTPAGVYFVELRTAAGTARGRLVRLP